MTRDIDEPGEQAKRAEPAAPGERFRAVDGFVIIALFFATQAVYAPSLRHDFVTMDDYSYVVENPAIQRGFDVESVRWAFTTFHGSSWFPLTWLSFMLDHEIAGLDAWIYHLMNLLWHAAGAALLYYAFVCLTGARGRSAFVAAVFALHPIHVESVVWVAERKDVLSAFFFAATLLAWARYVAHPSARRYALVFLALALGLLAKSTLVTVPFVLLLLDIWPGMRRGAPWSRLVVEKLPLFAIAGGAAALTFMAGASGDALEGTQGLPWLHRLANAAIAYASYMRDTVWPDGLSPFYPHPGLGVSMSGALASAGLLLLVTALVGWRRRSTPASWIGWLWFLGMLVPMVGLVQAGAQARADRFVHLAQTGLVVAVVWGCPRSLLAVRGVRPAMTAVAFVLVFAMAFATRAQLPIWRDGTTVFEHVVAASPESAFAWSGLGQAHRRAERYERAVEAYRRALAIQPEWSAPRLGLVQSLDALGRKGEALAAYQGIAKGAPDDVGVRAALAERLVGQGALEQAIPHLAFVAENADPEPAANALLMLGAIREQRGAHAVAARHYREAARRRPDFADPHLALARLALERGDDEAATAALRAAVRAEPNSLPANNNLAWHLASAPVRTAGDLAEARIHAERAARSCNRAEPSVLETLAVVLELQGEHGAARDTLEEAIALARARGDRALVARLTERRQGLAPKTSGGEIR